MPNLVRINELLDLKKYETKSQKSVYENVNTTIEVPLLLRIDGEFVLSTEWFFNSKDELIYDIKNNGYCIAERYDNGEAFVEDIYLIID